MWATCGTLLRSDFDSLYEELKAYDEQRETVIKRSRGKGSLGRNSCFV